MRLPNRRSARVPPGKLTGYLLSETHPVGKSKARFLRARGFDETNVHLLELGLLAIAHEEEVTEVNTSPYGVKYAVEGQLRAPDGSVARLRTIWIIETDRDEPRFVTAYPV